MEKLIGKSVEFCKKHKEISFWACLIGINITVFVVAMLLFEPTMKSDDYDMCNVLYGGVNGEYSPFVLYVNILMGYFLKFLLVSFPNISWYYVIQNLSIFLGFCAITYVLMKKNPMKKFLLFYCVFMLFAAYEVYVRITFSKTGALLMAAGLLLILYAIDQKAKISRYIIGVLLISLGILWRSGMLQLIVGMFFSVYVLLFVQAWKKWDKEFLKKSAIFILITMMILVLGKVANKVHAYAFNNDEVWGEYIKFNTVRSSVLDYGWPDYETFEKDYEKIGITQNDYVMWSKYANISDTDRFTEKTLGKIRSIYKMSEDEPLYEIIDAAVKHLCAYMAQNTMFYLWLACLILILIYGEQKNYSIIAYLSLCWIMAYLYMYYRGRLQNHVDASIAIAGSLILLYYASGEKIVARQELLKAIMPISVIFIVAVNYFYADITTSNYLGAYYGIIDSQKEFAHDNYNKMSLLSEDQEHLYLISAYETHTIYPCFAPDEIIEKGFYHNIFRLNQYTIPVFRQPLIDYNVENPFADIVNNKTMFYCASESRNFEINTILKYIQENYAQDTYCTLVKKVKDLYIYRFDEGKLQLDISDIKADCEDVVKNVEYQFEGNNLYIGGYVYMEGEDSFAQNVYIQIYNKKKNEYNYNYTLQMENEQLKDAGKYGGQYSTFETNVYIDEAELENLEVNLLLENDKGIYQIPINIGEE